MSTVGIKELKNRLTEYVRRVKLGDEVIITERGSPVAVIQPIQQGAAVVSLEARLARLAAQGVLSLPTRRPPSRVRRARVPGTPISRMILEDRR